MKIEISLPSPSADLKVPNYNIPFCGREWKLDPYVSVKSKLQHPPPPRAYHGHLTPLPSRGGGNSIIRVLQGVGNLIPMRCGWGIWFPCVRGGEFELHPRFHVKSLAWWAIMGDAVLGFSWKRLCLCGQLVTRKGHKQTLCHIWRYLNFNIFNSEFGLWMYECIKLCLQWNTIPIPAIQYNNIKWNKIK